MAQQDSVSVATSATEIIAADDRRLTGADGIVYLTNKGANNIWVGDASVASGEGLRIEAGKTEALRAIRGQEIYGLAETSSVDVAYLIR